MRGRGDMTISAGDFKLGRQGRREPPLGEGGV